MSSNDLAFTDQLRAASKKEHSLSNSLVGARLVVTATEKQKWARALSSFWHIFRAIEAALDKHSRVPEVALLASVLPKIRRTAEFEADLQTFYGLKWKEKAGPPTPAVQTYLERIDMLSADNPHLLVAHAYTQHLAMLAGGQVLRWSVRCTMQIARGDPGTAIFEFKDPVKELRQVYKDAVNRLDKLMGPEKSKQFVEEHRLVFQLNNAVIRTFPVSVWATLAGGVKLLPVEVLLIGISLIITSVLMWYTRDWVVIDPDTQEFADPDFVAS